MTYGLGIFLLDDLDRAAEEITAVAAGIGTAMALFHGFDRQAALGAQKPNIVGVTRRRFFQAGEAMLTDLDKHRAAPGLVAFEGDCLAGVQPANRELDNRVDVASH